MQFQAKLTTFKYIYLLKTPKLEVNIKVWWYDCDVNSAEIYNVYWQSNGYSLTIKDSDYKNIYNCPSGRNNKRVKG